MRFLLTLALLVVLAAPAYAVKRSSTEIGGQDTADSLAAAADTLSIKTLPSRTDALYVKAFADSSTEVTVEVANSPADSTEWFVVARDTVAAGEGLMLSVPLQYGGHLYRVILDNLTATTCYGDAYIVSER